MNENENKTEILKTCEELRRLCLRLMVELMSLEQLTTSLFNDEKGGAEK